MPSKRVIIGSGVPRSGDDKRRQGIVFA